MSVQVKGMQELIDYYDKIGDKKTPKKALSQRYGNTKPS